jgi:hypothetical protein
MKKETFAGEDPRKALKRLDIQTETQMQTQVYA